MDSKGLYGKFIIEKADGTPLHPDARYFVLNYAQDQHARTALLAYADSVEQDNPGLATELRQALAQPEQAHSHGVQP